MAKTRAKAVPVTFGGESRNFICDYNALAELQDLAGTYHSEVATLKAIRAVVWALLLAETLDKHGRETARTLSLTEVGEILAGLEKEELDAIVAAVMEARGIAEAPKEERPTPATETN